MFKKFVAGIIWLYSLINMRQLQICFNQPKTWHQIVCWFNWIYLYLPVLAWCDHKIVLQMKTKQFYDHIMQKLVKTGKTTEINKQTNFMFSLNWIKSGNVSYLLSRLKDFWEEGICTNAWLKMSLYIVNNFLSFVAMCLWGGVPCLIHFATFNNHKGS